ncbi:MAG: pyridoxal phosphate-dependent aminotransferase [bacterium]
MKLASRISRVQPSPTLAIDAKAKAMKAAGVDVISFGAGEPDFNTPEAVRTGAKAALDAGHTKYIASDGLPALRAAIAADYTRRGRNVKAEEVIVSTGGKHALYNATMALFEAGDKVIIPAPYWVSYPAQVLLADAEPVTPLAGVETGFKMTASQLEQELADPAVRGLILCSPSNPTGAVYSADELRAIGRVVADRPDVIVFFDAMYDRLTFDEPIAADFVAVNPDLEDRTITFNGFSKTYAMTGWRLGFAIGPIKAIKAMSKLQSQSTSNATSFAQYGALDALKLPDSEIEGMVNVFRRRRELIVGALNAIEGVNCPTPGGAFYVFPDVSSFCGEGKRFADDMALADYLLESAKVAVVPGSAFGAPGHMRMSYATSDELIAEGVKRIAEALA